MAPFLDYTLPADIINPHPEAAEGTAEEETIFGLLALLPVLLLGLSLLFAAYIVSRSRQKTVASISVLGFLRLARTTTDSASPLLAAGPAAAGSHDSESAPPTPTSATTVFEKGGSDSEVVEESPRRKQREAGIWHWPPPTVDFNHAVSLRQTKAFKAQPHVTVASDGKPRATARVACSFKVLVDSTDKWHPSTAVDLPSIRVFSSTGNITELAVGLTSFSSAERLRIKHTASVLQPVSGSTARKLRHRQLRCLGAGKENVILGSSVSFGDISSDSAVCGVGVQQSSSMPNVSPKF